MPEPDVRAWTSRPCVLRADGIHSTVRAVTFGSEERFVRPLGYRSAAYLIDGAILAHAEDAFSTLTPEAMASSPVHPAI
jgi:hypothetical protein